MIALAARFFPQRLRTRIRTTAVLLAVSLSGMLTACGGGDGGGGGASTTPPPTTPTLSSIAVTPATPSATLGVAPATVSLTATGTYSDGSTKVLTTTASWTSSVTTVATVGAATGVVTPVAAGTTTITATDGTVSGKVTFTVNPATLTSITITPPTPSATLGVNASVQLTATGTYGDGTTKNLTTIAGWTSSAPSFATIGTTTGLVTPVAAGTTVITATDGTVNASVNFIVNPATLASISITPASPSVALNGTLQLAATGKYSDGSTKPLTTGVTWASSATNIATVSATGLVTPLAQGTTMITATDGATMTTTTLTVTPPLSSIAITPATPSIAKGLTQAFTATGTYADGSHGDITDTVTWASGTQTVATISNAAGSNGIATGTGIGSASITASANSVTSPVATLTVTAPTLASVAINPTEPTIALGRTQQFSLIGTFTDGSTQDYTTSVTWASATPATATIGATTGLATTAGVGTTSISASAYGGFTAAPVTLTVSTTVYAYATNFDENTVSQYLIEPATSTTPGALMPLATPTIAAGTKPFSVSVEPTGQYAYVANYGSANVSEYAIGAGGQLTAVGTGTVATGKYPNGVTIDPADKHAYVANLGDSTVSQFSIGTDGVLIPLASATIVTGTPGPGGTAVPNPSAIAIEPNGKYAYVANFGDETPLPPPGPSTISQYTVNADGTLTLNSTPTAPCGSGPNAIAFVTISGIEYAYVVNVGDGTVSQYSISSTGVLTPLSPATVTSGKGLSTTKPFGLAVNPAGSYLYVANEGEGTISAFTISPSTGKLTANGTATPSGSGSTSGVSSVTVDATGKYVYGTNRGTNTISQFTISTNGALTPMTSPTVVSGITPNSNPTSIATGY